ncbi:MULTISPECIES: phage tail length tape measure family protein [unclassified Chelatococcus]|uniref:phage tail length tape measure family protein n=3 Tax=Chelatococcus TaxID=28209 RepID=UPI001BCC156E|nr:MULTISPECIES: phage tail length tape measure family protein [unclassified Chelatococcus]MBS7741437.1 phage tail length tape measure family protein [Chelatococcus sp. HY11]MCO5078935.1 phage tail length tape measure family protein [Chelatococcus sp.]
MQVNAIKRIDIQATTKGVEQATAGLNKMADAQGRVAATGDEMATATENTSRTALSAEKSLERLARRLDAEYRMTKQVAEAQALLDRGRGTAAERTEQYARVQDYVIRQSKSLEAANNNAATGIVRVGDTSKVAGHHIQNLGYQLNDVATMLAMGASPFQVLASQGGQIAQILGQTGVSGAVKGIGSAIGALITPVTAAGAAFVALGATALLAYKSFNDGQSALQQSLKGVGAATGATVDDLNRMAEAGAKAGNITVSAARSMAAEFAKTGKIGLSNFDDLIGITERFGKTVGLAAGDAAAELSRAFSDPLAGADKLNETLGFLDGKTRDHIRSLVDQNDQIGAQKVLIDALRPAIDGAAVSTTGLAGAWDTVAKAASNAFAWIGQAISAAPKAQQLAVLLERRQKVGSYDSFWDNLSGGKFSNELKQLDGQILDLQKSIAGDNFKAAFGQAAQGAARLSLEVDKINDGLDPMGAKYRTLKAQAADLQKQVDTANGQFDRFDTTVNGLGANRVTDLEKTKRSLDMVTQAYKSMEMANGKIITQEDVLRQKDEARLKALQAKTPAEKAAAAQEQARLDLIGETVGALDKQARIERAGALARQQAVNAASKAKKDEDHAVKDLMARNEARIEQMEMEAKGYGKTSAEVLDLRMQYELMKAAQRDGVQVTDAMSAAVRQQAERMAELQAAAKAAREELEAQEFSLDGLRDVAKDLLDASGSFADALKSLGQAFQSAALDALFTGKGPLAGLTGMASSDGKSTGGLFGALMGSDVKFFRDAVAKGTTNGLKDFVGPRTQEQMASEGGGLFGASGKTMAGGVTALAAAAAAYGGGLSSGSPTMGALTGVISGAIAGATFGPIGMAVGAVIGGGLGFLGGQSARKQQKEELQRQAQENYDNAKPQVAELGRLFRGDDLGNIQQQIQGGIDKLNELGPILVNAGHVDELIALQKDYNTFVARMKDEFRADFTGTIEELRAGLGAQGPFKQASDAVKQFGQSAKSFIADAKTVFGDGTAEVQAAREASFEYALSMLDQAKTLTEVQQSIQSINGTAAGLSKVLQELGMSAYDTAWQIEYRVQNAMDRLRDAFTDGLERRLNEASDRGYINEISDQIAQYRKDLADSAALGLDGALAAKVFAAEAQQIVNGAELAGDAFNALVQQFPELAGVVKEFSQALADMGNDLAAIAQRQQGYYDRIFNAANDNSTLEGALKAFDRQAQREREAEMKAGGQAITDLELALAAERVKIVNDFAAKAKAAEQQAAEQAARAAQQKVDEAQRAVDDARADLQRAYEQQASTINATISRLEAFTSSIRKLRTDLRSDDSLSPYNDRQQQQEAQATFQELAAKAMAGDQSAMDQLADAARRYLEESKAYYGFNEVYARIFEEVQSTLEAVGSKAQSELDIARAQLSALDAQVSGLLTVNDSVLTVAAGIEKLNAAVAALAAAQAAQIGNGTGTPDQRTAYVTSLYQKYFGRQPDQAGLDFWVKSDLSTSQLDQAFADAKAAGAMRFGGIVGAYARGGLIGNGIFDVDSVIARYAGGGNIALAGGEYVMPAHQTRANLPVLEAMRSGRAPANDDSAKEEIRALRALVEQLIAVSARGHQAVAAAVVENTSAVKADTRTASTAQIARRTGTNG